MPVDRTGPVQDLPSTPVFPSSNALLAVALYSFEDRDENVLCFQKRDYLEVLDESGDWWYARHWKTGKEGCIPSNYVAPAKSFYGTSGKSVEAEA